MVTRTIPPVASTPALTDKPCDLHSKKLGNHLPFCKLRNGRDYTQFLSSKTLKKKAPHHKTKCPKCNKAFLRLETHLRHGSATCKDVIPLSHVNSSAAGRPPEACMSQVSGEDAMFFTPSDSNSATAAPATLVELPLTTNPNHTSTVDKTLKPHLKYPTSKDGWEEANIFFRTTLVPVVVTAPDSC